MKNSRFECITSIAMPNKLTGIAIVIMLVLTVQSFATVSIQGQVKFNDFDFYGKAILDVIDQSDGVMSYESDEYGYFNVQISQPGQYDINIRHDSDDFEWIQYFDVSLTEGVNTLSNNTLYLIYNPDQIIQVPADRPTIQEALDVVQSGGWVIVSSQENPYEVNGLHWENKHVKLIGQHGTILTLGYGSSAHAVYLSWSGIDRSDLIKGFEFQECQVHTSYHNDAYGPALTLINGASPTIEDCSFLQNQVQNEYDLEFNDPRGFGGAVFIDGGTNQTQSPFFKNCLFLENNAFNANGGGAVALFGPCEFLNCTFSDNWTTTAVGEPVDAEFAAGAILIASDNHSGNIVIDYCTFTNNFGQNEANDIWVAECTEINEIQISNCTFDQETVLWYSEPVIKIFSEEYTQNFPTEFHIYNNKFHLYERGAVYFYDILGTSPMWFYNNTVIGEDDALYGLYIYSRNQENDLCFDNNTLRDLNENGLVLFQGTSYTLNNNLFDNCSPYDVKWGGNNYGFDPTESLTLNNCYFNDLTNHVDETGNLYQTYVANDLLIASSPQLGSNHEPLWTSSVISPVIDRGVSTMLDPDETPSDIGSIRTGDHQYDIYQMPTGFVSDGIKWMSFPIINNITAGYDVSENFFGPIVDPDILDWVQWKELDDPIETMEYVNTQLNNGNHVVNSVQGFKVKVQWDVFDEYSIPVTGYRQAPYTVIQLEGNEVENWIGYFCEESSGVLDAFSPILSNIKSIQTQYWSVYQTSPGVWLGNADERVLNDGDMVIVKCVQDCSFSWNNNQQVPPTSKGLATEFTYTEKPEYIPVYISIDQSNDPDLPAEIGLFVNGVCKGATVVDNPEVDICAYLNANEDITEENSQLIFFYPAKSSVNQRSTYNIEGKSLKHNTKGTEYYVITINDMERAVQVPNTFMLSQNYPNPFNPSTMITFEIPTDGLVSLDIFNVRGELVKRLLNTNLAIGKHSMVWDGKDNQGRHCSSGIYYYRLKSNAVSHTQKMLLLK